MTREKRWRPKEGEPFYFIGLDPFSFGIDSDNWTEERDGGHWYLWNMGNCYRTEKEARAALNRVRAALTAKKTGRKT